jgi:AI-2 transport system substrate-binding protein
MRLPQRLIFRLLMAALPLTALALAGCSGGDEAAPAGGGAAKAPGPINVLLIPKIVGNAFFDSANVGAQAYAAKHGFTVEYVGPEVAEVARQAEIIDRAVAAGAKAMAVSSLDAKALDPSLRRARARGVTVITWDSDVSPDARHLMVSQGTPAQLGAMLVEMAAKSLIKRGRRPASEPIRYAWHYSQASVTDQNSWFRAGEEYIRSNYPDWINVAPENYYSEQDPEKALAVGRAILDEHPDIDVIICNDSTSLPAQAQVLQERGLTARDVTVTGFAPPNAMRDYCLSGVIDRWGLWDCQIQAAMACYLGYYIASGRTLAVGQSVEVPGIGLVEVMSNSVLDPASPMPGGVGVVLLPSRLEFTSENVSNYEF